MIDFAKILKRSWQILWDYRVLWIFGILLVLTAGGGGNVNIRNTQDINLPQEGWDLEGAPPAVQRLAEWFQQDVLPLLTHPEEHVTTIVWIVVAVLSFALLISILLAIVRYVSETAIMRMVDEYEQNGAKVGFRQGWRLGWNRRAFRLWLIDVIVFSPLALALLMAIAGIFLLFLAVANASSDVVQELIVIPLVGSILLVIFPFVLVTAFLGLLRQFFVRAAALEGLGTLASLQYGWEIFRKRWKSAVLLWLIMAGVGIGFAVISIIAFFLLIPAYLLLLLPAALVAAIPGAIAFGVTSLFTTSPLSWIIGILFALPVFFTVLFAPLTLLEAWYQTYVFNVWTLAYREMKAIESVASGATESLATLGE